MPLFYQQNINDHTRLAIWKIEETESFFLGKVPLKRDITHPHKRLQHLAGRYLLPWLFPDFPHAEIDIADTRKPYLPNEQYHFSISHCGDYAAAIVSSKERVGIDIEIVTHRVEKIKHKFLHPQELSAFTNATMQSVELLTLLWSAKEAMFKWWGSGDVDFSEVLRIHEMPVSTIGNISASFQKAGLHIPLTLQYRLFEGLTLVWVHKI